jgi:hypothetical protein
MNSCIFRCDTDQYYNATSELCANGTKFNRTNDKWEIRCPNGQEWYTNINICGKICKNEPFLNTNTFNCVS